MSSLTLVLLPLVVCELLVCTVVLLPSEFVVVRLVLPFSGTGMSWPLTFRLISVVVWLDALPDAAAPEVLELSDGSSGSARVPLLPADWLFSWREPLPWCVNALTPAAAASNKSAPASA